VAKGREKKKRRIKKQIKIRKRSKSKRTSKRRNGGYGEYPELPNPTLPLALNLLPNLDLHPALSLLRQAVTLCRPPNTRVFVTTF
jgi:hypothetical protein